MNYAEKSQNDLFEEALKACEVGDLNLVMKLVQGIKFEVKANEVVDDKAYEIFVRACMHGQLDIVKELINNPYSNEYMNKEFILNESLIESSYIRNVDIISYLINEPNLNRHNNFNDKCYLASLNAAREGHIDTLEALLNLEFLDKSNRSILENGRILEYACNAEQYNVIEYIYNKPELQEYFNKDNCFKYVCIKQNFNLLRFFVLNLKVEKTQSICDFLINNEYREIDNLFKLRKVNQELNYELGSNNTITKKNKI